MTMVGADADRLEAAAAQMQRAADALDEHSGSLTRQLGGLSWLGQVAGAFLNMWNGHHNAHLKSTAQFIRDAAAKLIAQAQQQRDASQPAGSGPRAETMPFRIDLTNPSIPGGRFERLPYRIDLNNPPVPGGFETLPYPLDLSDLYRVDVMDFALPGLDSFMRDIGGWIAPPPDNALDWLRNQYDQLGIVQGVVDFGKAGGGAMSILGAVTDSALWLHDGIENGFWDGGTMGQGLSAIASSTGAIAGLASGGAALPALTAAVAGAPLLPVVAVGAATFGVAFGATNYVLDHFGYNGQSLGDHMSGSAYDSIYGTGELTVAEADARVERLSGWSGLGHYGIDAVSAAADSVSDFFDSIF
jgi:hypothetical protein